MKARKLTPMIWTDQLQETIDFYVDVLGFTLGDRNDKWGWAGLYLGEIDLMVARPNEHTPFEKPHFTGSFYFYIEDAESLWQELKVKAKVAYEIETFDWGMREFGLYDNNGYLLQFGQDMLEKSPNPA
ncbi:MAG: VOC family protein [Bacteroidia bacterium]|nr:VOC family protein [Bacteroidia bacterium]